MHACDVMSDSMNSGEARQRKVIDSRKEPVSVDRLRFSAGGWLIALYVLSLPLTMVGLEGFGSFERLFSLGVVACSVAVLTLNRVVLIPRRGSTWWILYAFWTLLTVLWASNPNGALDIGLGLFLVVGVSLLVSLLPLNRADGRLIRVAWLAMAGVCGLIFALTGQMQRVGERTTVILSSGGSDPNEFSAYFLLPLGILTAQFTRRPLWTRVASGLGVLAIFYIIFLSGSRGGLLGALAVVALVLFSELRRGARGLMIIGVASLLGVWLAATYVLPNVPSEVLQRLSWQAVMMDDGSGRVEIWRAAGTVLENSGWRLLFGFGPLGAGTARPVLHNHYLQALVDGGMIGFFLFLGLTVAALRNARACGAPLFAATVGTLITLLTLTCYANYRPAWVVLSMTLICGRMIASDDSR
jgi:O-antigen ligase